MPILIILPLLIVLFFSSVKIVPQTYVFVIERLGKYHKSCEAGVNFIVPFIDRVASKVNTKEQSLDFPPQPVITKDNVGVRVDSVVFMRVTNPNLYTYGIQNPIQGIENLSATTLRSLIGAMEFDQTLTSRDQINAQMLAALDVATDPWGIKVTRVEIKNIIPPADIQDVMQKQMTAEREKRQAILEAEGYRQASITHAEGDKQAMILAAEAESQAAIAIAQGKAESIRLVYEAESEGLARLADTLGDPENALRFKAIQAMKDLADGNATKIFFPTDLTEIGSLGLTGEALDLGGSSRTGVSGRKEDPEPSHVQHRSKVGSSPTTEHVLDAGHRAQANASAQMQSRDPGCALQG